MTREIIKENPPKRRQPVMLIGGKPVYDFPLMPAEKAAIREAIAGSPRNRILRPFAKKGARTRGSNVIKAIRRVERLADFRREQYAKALKAVRIRVKDRSHYVIFDTAGVRFPTLASVPKRRKIYMVWVSKSGRIYLLNPIDANTMIRGKKGVQKPVQVTGFTAEALLARAPRKFKKLMDENYGISATDFDPKKLVERFNAVVDLKIPRNGDIEAAYGRAAKLFTEVTRAYYEPSSLSIEGIFTVSGEKKPIRIITPQIPSYNYFEIVPGPNNRTKHVFKNRRSPKTLREHIRYAVNDAIRAELKARGLVSQGSANRIAKLDANKGRRRDQWVSGNGQRWFGGGLKPVRITSFQFRMARLK